MKHSILFLPVLLLCIVASARGEAVIWPLSNGGNGHSYEVRSVSSSSILWNQADSEARAAGGYLATITSSQENNFVFSLIQSSQFWNTNSSRLFGPWLGGYQPSGASSPSSDWRWVTGEPFTYANWYDGEPNDYSGASEDRIHYFAFSSDGYQPYWNDSSGYGGSAGIPPRAYIIERDINTVPEPSMLALLLSMSALLLIRVTTKRG